MKRLKLRKSGCKSKRILFPSLPLQNRTRRRSSLCEAPLKMPSLRKQFDRSLTRVESSNLFAEVRDANPNGTAKELGRALRATKLKAALVWRRMKTRDGKDSSLPLPLSLPRTVRLTASLSLRAQPKSDASMKVKYSLSLASRHLCFLRRRIFIGQKYILRNSKKEPFHAFF